MSTSSHDASCCLIFHYEPTSANESRLLEDAMLQRLSRRRVARLTADIDLLDQRLVEIVTADPALAHRFRLLTSMPGVGAVLACTLRRTRQSITSHGVQALH